jgi:hypothetical protein
LRPRPLRLLQVRLQEDPHWYGLLLRLCSGSNRNSSVGNDDARTHLGSHHPDQCNAIVLNCLSALPREKREHPFCIQHGRHDQLSVPASVVAIQQRAQDCRQRLRAELRQHVATVRSDGGELRSSDLPHRLHLLPEAQGGENRRGEGHVRVVDPQRKGADATNPGRGHRVQEDPRASHEHPRVQQQPAAQP